MDKKGQPYFTGWGVGAFYLDDRIAHEEALSACESINKDISVESDKVSLRKADIK